MNVIQNQYIILKLNFIFINLGSSIATSLIQAESKIKHIGLYEITVDKFRILPIKLESVRPFIYNQFELKQFSDKINKFPTKIKKKIKK